jgi:Fe-S cluster biosynthesis and repair protein YggX
VSEERKVMCRKLGEELPALKRLPFKNDLGQRIFNEVSQPAWDEWLKFSVRLINTAGLDLASPAGQREWMRQAAIYFGLEEGELMPTAWTPPKA